MSSGQQERLGDGAAPLDVTLAELPDDPDRATFAQRVAALLAAAPLALAAALAALAVVATCCLLGGAFRPALVLPIGLPLAVAAAFVVVRALPSSAPVRTLWPELAVLAVVLVAVGFNLAYGAQEIVVARDPGTYALTAQWLAHHASAHIATDAGVFGDVPGLTGSSLGFGNFGDGHVQSQYPNAAPMLAAMGGWIGDATLLRVAPLIGGAALWAFYALARGFVRLWWAAGATLLLAASMPMLNFSRALYSEPITMVFLLGGMALLFAAERTGGRWLHLVAGLTGGAAGVARIDGGIFLLAVAGYGVLRLAKAAPGRRRRTGVELALLVLAALVPYALGMRLTATLSPLYWYGASGHRWEAWIPGLLALTVAVAGAGVVAIAWRGGRVRSWGERWGGRGATALAGLVVVLAVVGATRPLWLTAHQYIGPTFTSWIAYWQGQEHSAIDGTRSYAEYTLTWLSWYDSVIVVVAGVLGIALLTRAFGRTGRPAHVALLVLFIPYSMVSLAYPDITADQIWSMRRFLPIVIPGFLIGAAYLGRRLWRYGRWARGAVAAAAVAALVLTVHTSWPLARVRDGVPQLAEVENVCANLPADAAVLVAGNLWNGYEMTVRSYCRVPTAGMPSSSSASSYDPLQPGELAQVYSDAKSAGRTLMVLTNDPGSLPVGTDGLRPQVTRLSTVSSGRWMPSLSHPPDRDWPNVDTLYLVQVHPDGTVSTPAGQRTLVASG